MPLEEIYRVGILGLVFELGTRGPWIAKIWACKEVRLKTCILLVDDALDLQCSQVDNNVRLR